MKKIIVLTSALFCLMFSYADTAIIDLQKKLHSIADNESASVVFISTEKTVKRSQQSFDPFEFFFNGRPGQEGQIPQQEFKQTGLGSGVVYSKKGNDYFIITNNHVIEGADTVKVTVDGRKSYDATIIGGDNLVDVAVLKLTTKDNLTLAKIGDSSVLRTADLVVAIGNPFGLSHSITFGIISALGRGDIDRSKPGFTNFIQTDAAINPGNSGGPLLNIEGEVVGINTMIYSQSGGSIGIGFAIPVNIAKNISEQLINKGKIEHGWIGITFQEMDKEKLEKLGIKTAESGMLVLQVVKDGPADKAGLKTGDVIVKIDKSELVKSNDLTVIIGNSSPGTKLPFTFIRDKSTIMKYVTIGVRDEAVVAKQGRGESDSSDKSAPDRYGLSLSESREGVVVNEVIPRSKAEQAGIRKGDIIYKVNNNVIKTISDFSSQTKDEKELFYFFINRNGETIIVMM
ncbi:MAG: hypothetical protein A2015_04615 [Spirochaetes bacterium GWF1_31_7]|nr:MAG: hypothetical protein A2Y30_04995 [Spirochaetes bacterium GWE1_32_154]OHD48753.1 MAG: hypothetical protein A2Y29_02970 [Spirochaetes bacterium GWE2_31_10]OHD52816.1 MAG: hypothetical protein A2015_04615 [Spirochaetes bacterium GWF1_31_7]OHD76251.1 MAG: hypothetical protein A2355_07805 [Spirochaetes bacterium RIFOXYB1_FULL_32_8]HBD95208.1 trypsin [Spirochaetia bacterium]